MCKKRRYFIKTKTPYSVLFFSLMLLFAFPERTEAQITNVLDDTENRLNTAVIERDFDTLWAMRNHSDTGISYRASMALIHADPVHSEWIFQQVIRSKSVRDWILLSHTDLNSNLLTELQQLSSEEQISPELACEVFYRKGDKQSLSFLLDDYEKRTAGERCAMALGGLMARVDASDDDVHRLLDLFEQSSNPEVRRNLLYGFYRSGQNRPQPGDGIHMRMQDLFLHHTKTNAISRIDEYFVRALGSDGVRIAIDGRLSEDLTSHVQFAVELARGTAWASSQEELLFFTETLIQHPNRHVQIELMESLKSSDNFSSEILSTLENHLNPETDHPEILLSYLDLLKLLGNDISKYIGSLQVISNENPYLLNRVYNLIQNMMDQNEFRDLLLGDLNAEGITSYRATEALGGLLDSDSLNDESRGIIKQEVLNQIFEQNRSVLSNAVQIFKKIDLTEGEIVSLNELYRNEYKTPDSGFAMELYTLLSEVDAQNYSELPEPVKKPFRKPDMNLLTELGDQPVWILETNRGEIRVRLYPQEAPFTVSSVVNLTNSGFYDDVAFHRVVKNHVIQGGDFDRRDGYGGPAYRIPTEPSIETFSRGKIGIASSGPDTEGSQFFITHTWRPHLDGLYTIFGEVIQGMEVVDRIQIGDKVISAELE